MKKVIRLSTTWKLGSQIGKGGFGRVYEANGADGRAAAVKLIPKTPGAERELLFENLEGVRCVVPILDSGEMGEYWVLVMPRATTSLRARLDKRGPLPPIEVVRVLIDVATALSDLQRSVVHRDIKPDNVLLLDGRWCLSDFGIARYAEASTAPDTRKWAWTSAYNAPERWRGQRAVAASDIYSLGIMAFEMLAGRLPFTEPDIDRQHLEAEPPRLTGCSPLLAALVGQCILKTPETRPTATDLLARLSRITEPSSPGANLLQVANAAQIERIGKESARASAVRSEAERRRAIAADATKILEPVLAKLAQDIRDNATAATWRPARDGGIWGAKILLGQAVLSFSPIAESNQQDWGAWRPSFDVIAHAVIGLEFPPDQHRYEGRSHSLWYCDAQEPGTFRWFETAFMVSALIREKPSKTPFALKPDGRAGEALAPALGTVDVAWPFTPVELGSESEFLERWMGWFAQAAQGLLCWPSVLPERRPEGSWRR